MYLFVGIDFFFAKYSCPFSNALETCPIFTYFVAGGGAIEWHVRFLGSVPLSCPTKNRVKATRYDEKFSKVEQKIPSGCDTAKFIRHCDDKLKKHDLFFRIICRI